MFDNRILFGVGFINFNIIDMKIINLKLSEMETI